MPETSHKSPEFADVCTQSDPEPGCAKCGSSTAWVGCWQCGGEGVSGHDCGEDTCCCLHPEDNEPCDICDGNGGWRACLSCNPGAFDD